jgi:signal transduction histidine kinase
MVAEVEDEQGIKVEMTMIGDMKLDASSEELIAAAREALRNAARHAPGAPVNLFLNINGHGVELFVRDSGPGFDVEAVPAERRGLRDAVIGRMSLSGGTAIVESTPGDGTEIALRLPPARSR